MPTPNAASAALFDEVTVRLPLAVPVCSVTAPPATADAVPLLPLAASIAASRLATVPVVEIWLAPAAPVTKVSVLPSTVMVSPAVNPGATAPAAFVVGPDSNVAEDRAAVVTPPPPRAWVMPEPRPRSVSTVAVPEMVRLAAVPVSARACRR